MPPSRREMGPQGRRYPQGGGVGHPVTLFRLKLLTPDGSFHPRKGGRQAKRFAEPIELGISSRRLGHRELGISSED